MAPSFAGEPCWLPAQDSANLLIESMRFPKRLAKAASGILCIGALLAFQRGFREFSGVEYRVGDINLPPDYQEKTEWAFARLMYPQTNAGRYGQYGFRNRFGNGDWRNGFSIWTQDYPRADRHFVLAVRRLTRLHVRSVEQPVNLDEGDVFDWPWLYAVQVGHWKLSDSQAAVMREYLLRGGFFMCDDFWGEGEWAVFMQSMNRVLPGKQPVDLANTDNIFHSVYDLDDRYQVASQGSVQRGTSWKRDGCPDHWRGIYDDAGRVVVAITYQSDVGDSWEWADSPTYPARYSALGMRIGINYIIYAMTH